MATNALVSTISNGPPFANQFFVALNALLERIATLLMSHRHKLPPPACTSYEDIVASTPAPILMPLLTRLLLFAASLLTWDIARKVPTVGRGTYESALPIPAALAVDSNIVHYLILIVPVR